MSPDSSRLVEAAIFDADKKFFDVVVVKLADDLAKRRLQLVLRRQERHQLHRLVPGFGLRSRRPPNQPVDQVGQGRTGKLFRLQFEHESDLAHK